jgi:hypothetical protein
VQFDGNLADAEIECDLLVEVAPYHFSQDFAFSRRQLCVAFDVLFDEAIRSFLRDIFLDRSRDRVKERLISYRLGKEVNGARFHRPDRHRDVAMTGQENNWPRTAVRGEVLLEIQPASSGHANIEDKATRPLRKIGMQEFLRRSKATCVDSHRQQEFVKRAPDPLVIVHKSRQAGGPYCRQLGS